MDEESVRALFLFAYTGQLCFTLDNIELMLSTALKLHISTAVKLCEKYIELIKATHVSI